MVKFKVGDILESITEPNNVVRVEQVTNKAMSMYSIVGLEGACVGQLWYMNDYFWTKKTIEENYILVQNPPQSEATPPYLDTVNNLVVELATLQLDSDKLFADIYTMQDRRSEVETLISRKRKELNKILDKQIKGV